jgi:hypothetical protein
VTITANPVLLVGTCDQTSWPWTCPSTADTQWDGYLDGELTDYQAWSDVAQRDSMYGMNYASNVSATSLPPEIVSDPTTGEQQILVRLANPHFEQDGTTVFEGFVHQRIPNAFLQTVYGIDDPSTLTSSGLTPVVSGTPTGTFSVTQESGGDAMLVDATDLTFSARKLLIHRGVVTPTVPIHVTAHRISTAGGRLGFTASKARGSRITGYAARCVHGTAVRTGSGKVSPVAVGQLKPGVGYQCRVKALSKDGPSVWSPAVTMPAHPA